ncbi:hypothetical protein N44_03315 [Microcystis aeruginosa NIES-44]|uniref:Uncharacterized protein n=1 Tax=Microcystis aeruginosa NIES-44 TaxID=449439 RepID=A0A0A1VYQ7_MICAE|nr:hypothetical protein N44_03315 [Microcystis aeruginosa NIES-44]
MLKVITDIKIILLEDNIPLLPIGHSLWPRVGFLQKVLT